MCAETTTYSFFSLGSLPCISATTLSDVTLSEVCFAVTRILVRKSNFGNGLSSFANARISTNVWPEPSNHFSARAGLANPASCRPAVSIKEESARLKSGLLRVVDNRPQGISMFVGLGIRIRPSAPAAFTAFQRSPVDCAYALSGPGTEEGAPTKYTT